MKSSWAVAALTLVLAGCGASEPDRFSLLTPGAHTGEGVPAPTSAPNPTATPELMKPVTRTERAVIKGWADSLRNGRTDTAASYFNLPSQVSNDSASWVALTTAAEAEAFNQGLPCGAKLIRTRRSVDDFVVGVFRLTERKGVGANCGTGVGGTVAVAFLIRDEHIQQWVRNDAAATEPAPTATPTPEPTTSAPPRRG